MPAVSLPRQANVSSWFDTAGAQALLQAEQPLILDALLKRPAQPWLWLTRGEWIWVKSFYPMKKSRVRM